MLTLMVSKLIRPELYCKFRDATIKPDEIMSYYGALPIYIERTINGERNTEYNHDLAWRYLSWAYVARHGDMDPKLKREVAGMFTQSFPIDRPELVPREICDEWLDVFRII